MAFRLTPHGDNPFVADELDRALEREAIERYVHRLQSGDQRPWDLEVWDPIGVRTKEESHWDMKAINANWAALHGVAPSAESPEEETSPPGSILPTVRLVASAPPARASGASSIRRSTVTTDPYTDRAANAIPNPDIDITTKTVEDIMRERGIGKRYAYAVLKQMSEEQNTADAVPDNQRERILAVLYRGGINNSQELKAALHKNGYEVNGHDTVKVLWSLQKTGHVRFRERQSPRMLFAIRLTDLGKHDGRRFATRTQETQLVVDEHPEPLPLEEAARAAVEATGEMGVHAAMSDLAASVASTSVGPDQQDITPPWTRGNMDAWPSFCDIRDRALRAEKLNAAAKILEEAGEDDMVLALMSKTDFTPLEYEVIAVLRFFKEIK